MKLTHDELEFLSAWAREEWEPACYQLPRIASSSLTVCRAPSSSCSSKPGRKARARRIKTLLRPLPTRNPAGPGPRPRILPIVWRKPASGEQVGDERIVRHRRCGEAETTSVVIRFVEEVRAQPGRRLPQIGGKKF